MSIQIFALPPGSQTGLKLLRQSSSYHPSGDAKPNPPPGSGIQGSDTTVVDSDGNFVHTVVRAEDGSISITITSPSGKVLQQIEEDKDGNVISSKDFRTNWLLIGALVVGIYFVFIHKF